MPQIKITLGELEPQVRQIAADTGSTLSGTVRLLVRRGLAAQNRHTEKISPRNPAHTPVVADDHIIHGADLELSPNPTPNDEPDERAVKALTRAGETLAKARADHPDLFKPTDTRCRIHKNYQRTGHTWQNKGTTWEHVTCADCGHQTDRKARQP